LVEFSKEIQSSSSKKFLSNNDFREVLASLVVLLDCRVNGRNAPSSVFWGVDVDTEEKDDFVDGRAAFAVVLDGTFQEAELDGFLVSLIFSTN
jgi:hypothetical protein